MRIAPYSAMALLLCCTNWLEGQESGGKLPQERFLGEWINVDNATRGIKRLLISKQSDTWSIEVWGVGGGGTMEIPWKAVSLSLLGKSISDKSLPYGFASCDSAFKVSHLILKMEGEQLIVENFSIFKDKSGRSNFHTVSTFVKK